MSLYKSLISLGLCLFLTACGFHPLYSPTSDDGTVCYPLKIATIPDRDGQILRNHLVDLLIPSGTPLRPLYVLNVQLTETTIDTGIRKDETTKRKQVTLTGEIILTDAKCRVVYKHCAKVINSFAVIGENYYSDYVAENYAKKEALRLLAEKIKIFVIAYLDRQCECQ
jgi:LPS-assembly lipoprotein